PAQGQDFDPVPNRATGSFLEMPSSVILRIRIGEARRPAQEQVRQMSTELFGDRLGEPGVVFVAEKELRAGTPVVIGGNRRVQPEDLGATTEQSGAMWERESIVEDGAHGLVVE